MIIQVREVIGGVFLFDVFNKGPFKGAGDSGLLVCALIFCVSFFSGLCCSACWHLTRSLMLIFL